MKINDHVKRIVFCDFDGTITQQETFVAMLHTFAPQKMKEFSELFSERKISLREGVRAVVESIPSNCYKDMVAFIKDRKIREGFEELLIFLKNNDTPFFVISGGLKDSVQSRLAQYKDYIDGIYAPDIDDSGKYLKMVSDYEGGDELVAKVKVMELYSYEQSIAIGDGATDHKMAMNASLVFARDRLARFLDEKNINYISWHDFFEVKEYLEKQYFKDN